MTATGERLRADVVVIGGGVIGLSLSCELQARGNKVLVLEAAQAGSGATQASGGMLGPIAEAQIEEPEIITLGLDSLARYPEFVGRLESGTGLATGFRREGTLIAAATRDHLNELEHLQGTFRAKGLTADALDAPALLELEPRLSPRVLGGLRIAEDLRIDPRLLTAALVRQFQDLGGRILEETPVREVRTGSGRVTGVAATRGIEIDCAQVVVATGAAPWDRIDLPVPDPGIRPVKGQLVRLKGEELLRHVVRSPDIYLIPQPGGELFVGATMEEVGLDGEPTAGAVFDLLRFGWQLLPGIYDLEFLGVAVGHRPAVDDHMPVIGPAETAGLWLAVGHFRKGVLMAPATAAYLADWMAAGSMPEPLAPFSPDRLRTAATGEV